MAAHSYEDLIHHVGHKIVCVTYGDPAVNVAVECETCSEVLMDFEKLEKKKDCQHEHTVLGWAPNQPSFCEDCGEEL